MNRYIADFKGDESNIGLVIRRPGPLRSCLLTSLAIFIIVGFHTGLGATPPPPGGATPVPAKTPAPPTTTAPAPSPAHGTAHHPHHPHHPPAKTTPAPAKTPVSAPPPTTPAPAKATASTPTATAPVPAKTTASAPPPTTPAPAKATAPATATAPIPPPAKTPAATPPPTSQPPAKATAPIPPPAKTPAATPPPTSQPPAKATAPPTSPAKPPAATSQPPRTTPAPPSSSSSSFVPRLPTHFPKHPGLETKRPAQGRGVARGPRQAEAKARAFFTLHSPIRRMVEGSRATMARLAHGPLTTIQSFDAGSGNREEILGLQDAAHLRWALNAPPQRLVLTNLATGETTPLDPGAGTVEIPGPVRRRQLFSLQATLGGRVEATDLTLAARGIDRVAGDTAHPRKAYRKGAVLDQAAWRHVTGLAMAPDGSLLFSEGRDQTIRKVQPDGQVVAFAGRRGVPDLVGDGGPTQSDLNLPGAMAILGDQLYIVDEGTATIKAMPLDGSAPPRLVAGSLQRSVGLGRLSSHDGIGDHASFNQPRAIAAHAASGLLFVLDRHRIRILEPTGQVTTLPEPFEDPRGLAVDADGRIYVADGGRNRVLRLVPVGGLPLTLQTSFREEVLVHGFALEHPGGLALDPTGRTLFMVNQAHNLVQRISLNPSQPTVRSMAGSGFNGFEDGTTEIGTVGEIRFDGPTSLVAGPDGLYVADQHGTALRRIQYDDKKVTVQTLGANRGEDSAGARDGDSELARFHHPMGVAVDRDGRIYVADRGNQAIRLIGTDGRVVSYEPEIPGRSGRPSWTDPTQVAVDGQGRMFVLETDTNEVWMVDAQGRVSIPLDIPDQKIRAIAVDPAGTAEHPELFVALSTPEGRAARGGRYAIWRVGGRLFDRFDQVGRVGALDTMAVDRTGAVYIASRPARTTTCAIRRFRPDGNGRWQPDRLLRFGPGTGRGDQAGTPKVTAMATDPAGNLYLADAANGIVWGAGPALDTVAVVAGAFPELAPVASPRALDTPLYQLHGIAVSPHGDLVLTSGNGVIQITAPGFVPPAPAAHPVDTTQTQAAEGGPTLGGIPPPPPPPEEGQYEMGPDPLAEARNRAGKGGGGNERPKQPDLMDQLRRKQKEKAKRAAGNPGGGGGVDAALARQRKEKAEKDAADAKAKEEAARREQEEKAQRRHARNQAPSGPPPGSTPVSSSSSQIPAQASSSSPRIPAKAPAKRANYQADPGRPHALPENLLSGIRAAGAGRRGMTADQIRARDAEEPKPSEEPLGDKMLQNLSNDRELAARIDIMKRRKALAPEDTDVDPDEWDPDKK